jgi:hypothetical protein
MLHVTHTDRMLVTEALACLDTALRAGRLDPERRELQMLDLPSDGRLLIGWSGRLAVASLRRFELELPRTDSLADGEKVVAAFQSAQSGRRNLAALIIRLLAIQIGQE